MDNSAVQYAGFIVAALIIIWGVIEINRRYFRRKKMDARTLNTWVHLDASQPEASEDSSPTSAGDEDAAGNSEQDIQTRARQNGHYSESKRAF